MKKEKAKQNDKGRQEIRCIAHRVVWALTCLFRFEDGDGGDSGRGK